MSFSFASGRKPRAETLGIGLDVEFLDVAAVRVHLDGWQHIAAFVVIAVGELVTGGNGFHADVGEQILIVVGARTADEERGFLAHVLGLDLGLDRAHGGHFGGDDFLDAGFEFLVVEELRDLAQRLRGGFRADEVHLEPRDAELGFHHLGHVVDRAVAHDDVEVGLVALGDFIVADVS